MGSLTVKVRGGKKPVIAMVNGELSVIKKASKFDSSLAIFLPREWIMALEITNKRKVEKFALTYNCEVLTIRPYFGEAE